MPRRNYERTIHGTVREISKLLNARDAINVRLVELLAAVRGMSLLLGESGPKEEYVRDLAQRILQPPGLKAAIAFILRTSSRALRPAEVRDELLARGYDLRKYTFPMGAIHGALRELIEKGEIRPNRDRDGTKSYAYRPPTRTSRSQES